MKNDTEIIYKLNVDILKEKNRYNLFTGKYSNNPEICLLIKDGVGDYFKIRSIHDLRPFVQLKSCIDVLSYVRFLTSPVVFNILRESLGFEIMCDSEINMKLTYGVPIFEKNKDLNGYCGVISRAQMKMINIEKYKCWTGKKNIIERYVINSDDNGLINLKFGGKASISKIVEKITLDGEYTLESKKNIINKNFSNIDWRFMIDL